MEYTGTPKHLPNESPNQDGLFQCQESVDPQPSVELLREPVSCYSEHNNDSLVDPGGRQSTKNDTLASDGTAVQAPPLACHHDDVYNFSSLRQELSDSVYTTPDALPNETEIDQIEDTTNCPTPTPTQCSRLLGNVSEDCSSPMTCAGQLYSWLPETSGGGDQRIPKDQTAMQELKEMECRLRTDTKQRILQLRKDSLRGEGDPIKKE